MSQHTKNFCTAILRIGKFPVYLATSMIISVKTPSGATLLGPFASTLYFKTISFSRYGCLIYQFNTSFENYTEPFLISFPQHLASNYWSKVHSDGRTFPVFWVTNIIWVIQLCKQSCYFDLFISLVRLYLHLN